VERVADFLPEPIAERIAMDKSMETEPPGKKDQYEQDREENQKTSGFHERDKGLRSRIGLGAGKTIVQTIR
jgi:hypothetical protein